MTKELSGRHILLQFLINPRLSLLRQAAMIGVILLLDSQNKGPRTLADILSFFYALGLIYFNIYLLVPRMVFRQKYGSYFLWVLIVSVISFALVHFSDPYTGEPGNVQLTWSAFLSVFFVVVIILSCTSAIKLFQQWVKDRHRLAELEKHTLEAELERLKSQINPHFLFNMLNNVNVLTRKDPAKASEVVEKLSELLRYQLYDSAQDNILLISDIQFLRNFLHLEKIRRDRFEFTLTISGRPEGIRLPPFLFIPFVENAVKHNADSLHESFVHLSFDIREDSLLFVCENSRPAGPPPGRTRGGLGLANIRRRLDLLYSSRYSLFVRQEEYRYTVQLSIPL